MTIPKLHIYLEPLTSVKPYTDHHSIIDPLMIYIHKLSQAKMFSIVDFSKVYFHIELDGASLFLTTLNTPLGKFSLTRMQFGVTAAEDAFQQS